MKITRETVAHVARLAALELTEEEFELYTQQLNRILEYIDKLQTLDLAGVEPFQPQIPRTHRYRPDEPQAGLTREEALQNAPDTDGVHFKVPRVLGGEP